MVAPAWLARLQEHRAYGTFLLVVALGLPLLLLSAVVVMLVTFSWSVSPEYASTWGLISLAVVAIEAASIAALFGRRQRYPRALHRLIHQAEAGRPESMAALARQYAEGSGRLPRDPTQAAGWWRRLAEAGDPEGAFRWGLCLLEGHGVLRDAARGRAWLEAAAAADHAEARARLAELPSTGSLSKE